MELTSSAPLLAHYSVDLTPPMASPAPPMASPTPPMASPTPSVAIPIAYAPLAQLPSLNISPVHTCNDCNSSFTRNEKDKGSSAYYRCASCQSKMLQKAIVYSCIIH